ncbi:tRNA (guanosine(37)-N1)-methyltransferase TrmD [Candidatus Wolfebacteria bacterium]|nr:tRNA (guanosine(37)-N1)-methyltransferase TrmD [Candidatus Wolfebacteria bacterium]
MITIFPHIFDSYLNESILKRAQKKNLIQIKIHNLRDFTKDKHKKVDDKPYGGGAGMVLKIEPIIRAASSIKRQASREKIKIILFSPAGKQFNNKIAAQLAKNYKHLILICGRYEGIDERVKKVFRGSGFNFHELSIGPYVLTGGELPAMVLIDAVSRQIPGVLGKQESLEEKRFGIGAPAYTRPEVIVWKGKKYPVPKVLLSGNHKKIEEWRKKLLLFLPVFV